MRSSLWAWLFCVCVAAGLVSGCGTLATTPGGSRCLAEAPTAPANAQRPVVQRVVDGDTFIAADGTRVRILGIDTPETVKPGVAVQWYGKEASSFTAHLLTGQTVLLEPGRNPTDRYGRLLAWVWLADGRFVDGELVRLGYARVDTFADNPDFHAYLTLCQREAQQAKRGVWSK